MIESEVEQAALSWLTELGWTVMGGRDVAPDSDGAERSDYAQTILDSRLIDSVTRFNPHLPQSAVDNAIRKLMQPEGATIEARNRSFHRMVVEGVTVEYRIANGMIRGAQVRVIDFDKPEMNDWLAVNQFTLTENRNSRRLDVVLFVNGLPLGIIELKRPGDRDATIWTAWQQLQTYKAEFPTLFSMNELLIVSDGVQARCGTLTGGWERFKPWRTIGGRELADSQLPELQVALAGICDPLRLLTLIRDFIVIEDDGGALVKKIADYHQFHAVRVAVDETLRAAQLQQAAEPEGHYEAGRRPGGDPGDRRIGVVWHTQGSGKSLTMAFYAGSIVREPAMQNPTIVVITDRNDLDNQLFTAFARCQDLLRQPPLQAESRSDLRIRLSLQSGGVVFTTIQKFLPDTKGDAHPALSERRNIVVIADEAHRSQYDFIDGFARHMRDALPNASFIGFTGTPIELEDKSTSTVFGEYISVYDIRRAVEDRATVPIYYESRLASLRLDEHERPKVEAEFEEVTEGEEVERREKLKAKWAQQEAIAGAERRLKLVACDIVAHFERRLETLAGKAMVVCMSRRICVDLYRQIVALRPQWHADSDNRGDIKIVMTGSASDPVDWQQHIRSKQRRELLAKRFRDPDDSLRMVLVRDMWLTGFDAPALHTMYADKPMRGHSLMQAIARVNRVFKEKPGGLVVDYIGLVPALKSALHTYTESGGQGEAVRGLDRNAAVDLMREKHHICCSIVHGFDWSDWTSSDSARRLAVLPAAQEHVLAQENGKDRFMKAVYDLSRAFSLAVTSDAADEIHTDVAFFQTVGASLAKRAPGETRADEDLDSALRQIVSRAVASDRVIDIFEDAGLRKPDISILSDDFLAEVRNMPHKNLAVELLRKLLRGEIRKRRRTNVVQAQNFLELLEAALRRYQNRAIEAAQVIEELLELARDMRDAQARGEALDLTDDELAFYDALETNLSAVQVLGDATLRLIAQELVESVRANVSIDWTVRENVRARLRVLVKRILRKHGYPPDKQEKATQLVLEQASALSETWAIA